MSTEKESKLKLPYGLTAIVSSPQRGKSTLARMLFKEVVLIGEDDTATLSLEEAKKLILAGDDLTVFDSLRTVLTAMGGQLSKSGLPLAVANFLQDLHSSIAAQKKRIGVILTWKYPIYLMQDVIGSCPLSFLVNKPRALAYSRSDGMLEPSELIGAGDLSDKRFKINADIPGEDPLNVFSLDELMNLWMYGNDYLMSQQVYRGNGSFHSPRKLEDGHSIDPKASSDVTGTTGSGLKRLFMDEANLSVGDIAVKRNRNKKEDIA